MTDKMNNNDNDLIEKKIDSKNVFDGHLLHVRCDSVRLPNGNVTTREWVKHPGAAAVLPILPDGRVILVRQYRYPVQRVTLEIPAGKLDSPDENPLDCAKRELAEETGFGVLEGADARALPQAGFSSTGMKGAYLQTPSFLDLRSSGVISETALRSIFTVRSPLHLGQRLA